jgi:hypothetical protein
MLLLPDYGRVLGIFALTRAGNALWVNPEFLRRLAIGAKDDRWMNPGGDRMWLAPRDEYIGEGGEVPASLDPGQFTGRADRTGYTMENKGEARAWKSGVSVRFRLVRRIQPITESRLEESWGKSWLRRAGYEEETQLSITGPCPRGGTWLSNSIQLPARAQARIPLRRYWADTAFSHLPPGEVGLEDACLVLGQEAGAPRSIGLAAGECAPRFLCIVAAEPGHAQLLVKDFDAAGAEDREGPLVECRWGGREGPLEMSCSSAAVGQGERLSWKTSTCVFSGRVEEIRALAARIAR